ncbi:MAG: putative transrane protein [Actinomycetia bacterium]|nr:putative transrane protein [Actinomycetes bacterium]
MGPTPSDSWVPPGVPAGTPWGGYPGGAAVPGRTEPLAIVSLVAGILQFVLPFFAAILAIVTGHVARRNIRRSEGRLQGGGLALAGLILGYIGAVFTVLVVGGLITVIAVFHDDWARTDTRHQVERFAQHLDVVSAQLNAGPRDANVIARAWGESCDCRSGNASAAATVADGGDIFRATDAEWARAGWRMEFTTNQFGDVHMCFTIPSEPGAAGTLDEGSCAIGSPA